MISGTVSVCQDDIRKSLGVCPQHDILFPELTVSLYFCFRSVSWLHANLEVFMMYLCIFRLRNIWKYMQFSREFRRTL